LAVFETPERTPPGAVVVSTSTTVELSTCGCCVASGVGVKDSVGDDERDGETVPLGEGDAGIVGVTDGVTVKDFDAVPVPDAAAPVLGVCVGVYDGDGVIDICTTPWM
jgi:hypothetical protein